MANAELILIDSPRYTTFTLTYLLPPEAMLGDNFIEDTFATFPALRDTSDHNWFLFRDGLSALLRCLAASSLLVYLAQRLCSTYSIRTK